MNVLFLVPDIFNRPGGIARYCRLVAKALSEWPHVARLDVVALHDSPSTPVDARYLYARRYSFRGCGGSKAAFVKAAARAVLRQPYELIISGHAHFSSFLLLPMLWQRRARRVTFIYGVDAWCRLPWHRRWPLLQCDAIIAISRFTRDRAIRGNRFEARRVKVLHNCLDPYLGREQAPRPLRAADVLPPFSASAILTVGRLAAEEYEQKGHDAVIRALPMVLRSVPDAAYYVVGNGERRGELACLAAKVGVAHKVHFLGQVPDAAVDRSYQMAKVFAMPSKSEGFGFVFLEAMAHGCPVVAGNRDAAPEVLGRGEAGLLIDPDDIDGLAAAITTLLCDGELRQRLGSAGRERLGANFTYDRFRDQLWSYLDESSNEPDSRDS